MALMGSLARLAWDEAGPLMVTSRAFSAGRMVPVDLLVDHCTLVTIGETMERATFLEKLTDAGYRSVRTVEDPGTVAVRGGIIDVFPHSCQPRCVSNSGVMRSKLSANSIRNPSAHRPRPATS